MFCVIPYYKIKKYLILMKGGGGLGRGRGRGAAAAVEKEEGQMDGYRDGWKLGLYKRKKH